MGQIAGADLIVLEKGLKTAFFKSYEATPSSIKEIATVVPSNSDQEKYGWLGSAPIMEEWKDERNPKGLLQHDYTIINNHYEASIGVNKDDFDDDKYGQIKVRVNDMGVRAKEHPGQLLTALRVAGTSGLCYDGQYFYDTDHSEGSSGTQSNIVTGTGTSLTNLSADFTSARAKFRRFLDDRAKPFHPKNLQFLITAPPDLETVFEQLLNATEISNTTNVLKGAAKLEIDPELSDTVDWYLDVTNRYIKGFIFQERKKIDFASLTKDSESGFMRNHHYYGVDARYNCGYGLWQNSVKVNNS